MALKTGYFWQAAENRDLSGIASAMP